MLSNVAKEAIDSFASDDSFCSFATNQVITNSDECYLMASCDKEVRICLSSFSS